MIYGHEQARTLLERELPTVALLRGPESVGKWQLGLHLLEHHGVLTVDQRQYRSLDMGAARDVLDFSERAPFGQFKCVLMDTDGADQHVLSTMLKLLEEPPPRIRFILVASKPLLDTITSRASVYSLGLLSTEEVAQVLCSLPPTPPSTHAPFNPETARRFAQYSRGQVRQAMQAANLFDSKSRVLKVVEAIATKNFESLDRAVLPLDGNTLWGEEEQQLLQVWAVEASTKRWRVFTEAESCGLDKTKKPRVLLEQLKTNANPVLALRSGLTTWSRSGRAPLMLDV